MQSSFSTAAVQHSHGVARIQEFLRDLAENAKTKGDAYHTCKDQKDAAASRLAELRKNNGFRDKYLGGLFGGNRQSVIIQKELAQQIEGCKLKIPDLRKAYFIACTALYGPAEKLLTDESVKTTIGTAHKVQEAFNFISNAIGTLDRLITKINDCHFNETIDGAANNSGMSYLSKMELDELNEMIGSWNRKNPGLIEALSIFDKTRIPAGMDQQDFGFLGGFQAASYFNLGKLEKLSGAAQAIRKMCNKTLAELLKWKRESDGVLFKQIIGKSIQ